MDSHEQFLWGAATSSHQIEGGNEFNDWWAWEQKGNCEGGVTSGRATDHWNRYKEDLRLASELGLNSYRFSVEWSRLQPEENRFDSAALEWYRELIAECEKRKLLPMLTLHHFTSPKWFAERGGFTWDEASDRFAEYTRLVVKKLGSRVPLWCTLNEPMVMIAGGYLGKFMPPALFSPELAAKATRQLLKCHVKGYEIIHGEMPRREGPWKDHSLMVGIAQNMLDFVPDRPWHPLEQVMTKLLIQFYNRAWLDAVTGGRQNFGVVGLVPNIQPVPEARAKCTSDFIGLNYYTKAYVQWKWGSIPVGLNFAKPGETKSDLDWAIHPQGLSKMLNFVKKYRLPIYITENGIADADDSRRKEYLRSHLKEVGLCIENGADIRGYYYWSLLDNFEWIKGFGPRFGLFQVDYSSFERKITSSAKFLKSMISAHHDSQKSHPNPNIIQNLP